MAAQYDASVPVGPGEDRTWKINMSACSEFVAGDTVASGAVAWGAPGAPPTVGAVGGVGTIFASCRVGGFVNNVTYSGTFTITTSSGAVIPIFVQFVCGKPAGF